MPHRRCQIELYTGVLVHELPQTRREPKQCEGQIHLQFQHIRVIATLQNSGALLQHGKGGLHGGQIATPFIGQFQSTGASKEQRAAHRAFQALDLLTDRRLRHAQLFSCRGEAQRPR